MADTIVTNSPGESGAGMMFAMVLLVIVAIAGAFLYTQGYLTGGSSAAAPTEINVTVPTPTVQAPVVPTQ